MEYRNRHARDRRSPSLGAAPRRDIRLTQRPDISPRTNNPQSAKAQSQDAPKERQSTSSQRKRKLFPFSVKLSKKKGVALAAVLVLSAVSVGALAARQHVLTNIASNTPTGDDLIENVEYQTVIPEGRTIAQLGGWKRISPPEQEPVYAYGDSIDGVKISVSQQPLPNTFSGNSEKQVAEAAKAYNATTELKAGTTTAYLGTSSKGPQSVILTKNNLLIMIKSEKNIPNTDWINYIKTLN